MAQILLRGNIWYARFSFKGKRYLRSLGTKNKREAQIELGRLVEKVRGERAGSKHDLPWDTFKEILLRDQQPHKRENTQKRDKASLSILEDFSRPKYLSDVTQKSLRELTAHRIRMGRKPASIAREISGLKAMMRWAEVEGYRKIEEWRSVKIPRVPRKRPHYHKKAELKNLMGACRGVWKTICWLGSRAGLRRAEIYWLRKDDVDFIQDIVRIREKDGWRPKDSDERDILLLPDLKSYLKVLFPKTPEKWALGSRPSLAVMSIMFRRITANSGLVGGIQTLRHTYGTHLANDGVNIYALQKWMGHSDVRTTMGYLNPGEEHRAEIGKISPI